LSFNIGNWSEHWRGLRFGRHQHDAGLSCGDLLVAFRHVLLFIYSPNSK
jgi:hypothetical protein